EVPTVDLSLADIVADNTLLDAAFLNEVNRLVDRRHNHSRRLGIHQVARLGQDDDPGFETPRLIALSDFAGLLRPEHEGAVVEDVTLRQRHASGLGPELFEALIHGLLAGVTIWPPLFTTKEDAIDFPAV